MERFSDGISDPRGLISLGNFHISLQLEAFVTKITEDDQRRAMKEIAMLLDEANRLISNAVEISDKSGIPIHWTFERGMGGVYRNGEWNPSAGIC